MTASVPSPPTLPGLIDTHCHLDYAPMAEDIEGTFARCAAAGVVHIVHIGCSPDRWQPAIALAHAHPNVSIALGIHPHEAGEVAQADLDALAAQCTQEQPVAIGETGLDYYYDRSPRKAQQRVFAAQLDLALALQKPCVLHIRDAHDDALALVRAMSVWPKGIVHCFTGNQEQARAWLNLGFHLSFSGIVTFKNARDIQDAARLCPPDRLLTETDAPFLAPVPVRGQPNQPANVAHTAAFLATLRGEDPLALATSTSSNARALLDLPG